MGTTEIMILGGVALWVLLLTGLALRLYLRRRNGSFYAEHALVIGSLLLLALAPCVLLVIRFLGGTPSIAQIAIHLVFAGLLLVAAWQSRRQRLSPGGDDGSTVTYSEKSAAVVVLGQLVVFGGYFWQHWSSSLAELIPAFVGALVLLVIIMVVGHIIIALFHYPIQEIDEPLDERARQIEALADRNGNLVIMAGFWTVPFLALSPAPAALVINCWLAFLVLSAVVKYGSIVAYARLGVR